MIVCVCSCLGARGQHQVYLFLSTLLSEMMSLTDPGTQGFSEAAWPLDSREPPVSTS